MPGVKDRGCTNQVCAVNKIRGMTSSNPSTRRIAHHEPMVVLRDLNTLRAAVTVVGKHLTVFDSFLPHSSGRCRRPAVQNTSRVIFRFTGVAVLPARLR